MTRKIQRAVVCGAGVMGSAIAAHLANVGIEVLLLDRVSTASEHEAADDRNAIARRAKEQLRQQKPSSIYAEYVLERITVGNFEDHFEQVGQADWIIEAIVEKLEVKQSFFARMEEVWHEGTIVSSNTSGISIASMVQGRSAAFRRHFIGTHFFNPPRYMKLLELIPTDDTDPAITTYLQQFASRRLGKGVIVARDTPNFIANRIGTYSVLTTIHEMEQRGLRSSEVDELTGGLIGRAKSATLRTADLVGLDTLALVAGNVLRSAASETERVAFSIPRSLECLLAQGFLGRKTDRGFYWVRKSNREKQVYEYDFTTCAYVEAHPRSWPSLDQAKLATSLKERLRILLKTSDEAGMFVWSIIKKLLLYSASVAPKISEDYRSIDKAMKWGFNWQLGPFELWDVIGVQSTIERMKAEGDVIPKWVIDRLAEGNDTFYSAELGEEQRCSRKISLSARGLITENAGARLIDLGDDVACLAFQSPHHVIGPDVLEMVHTSLDIVKKSYRGLVIGHQGKNFCLGANLLLLLLEAQDDNWEGIERMVREFQQTAMAIKYFERPIVAAPFQLTLGGGVEMCLPAAHVQASAETYMGLVEVGVGLIPAGGGCKEMLCRVWQQADVDGKNDLRPFVQRVFETIAFAKVSSSAEEARNWGYLRANDRITFNTEQLLFDAKQAVLQLDAVDYVPPVKRRIRVIGEAGLAVLKLGIYQMKLSGRISDFDAKIGGKLAAVLAGGSVKANTYVSEQHLLDLEREAFLSLCGEPKTQARMEYMLTKRMPLRN